MWAKSMAARFSEDWRDKSETAHTGANGAPLTILTRRVIDPAKS
jgi:hypothetical protein